MTHKHTWKYNANYDRPSTIRTCTECGRMEIGRGKRFKLFRSSAGETVRMASHAKSPRRVGSGGSRST